MGKKVGKYKIGYNLHKNDQLKAVITMNSSKIRNSDNKLVKSKICYKKLLETDG